MLFPKDNEWCVSDDQSLAATPPQHSNPCKVRLVSYYGGTLCCSPNCRMTRSGRCHSTTSNLINGVIACHSLLSHRTQVVMQNFIRIRLPDKLVGMHSVQLILIEQQYVRWIFNSRAGGSPPAVPRLARSQSLKSVHVYPLPCQSL